MERICFIENLPTQPKYAGIGWIGMCERASNGCEWVTAATAATATAAGRIFCSICLDFTILFDRRNGNYLFIHRAFYGNGKIDVRWDWYRCGGHILDILILYSSIYTWYTCRIYITGFVSFENCRQNENGGDCLF